MRLPFSQAALPCQNASESIFISQEIVSIAIVFIIDTLIITIP